MERVSISSIAFNRASGVWKYERQGDFSASLDIVSRVRELGDAVHTAEALEFSARAHSGSGQFVVTLMEADGTSWVQRFALTDERQDYSVPLNMLEADKGVLLPQAYPGSWSYWVEPPKGRGGPDDRIQLDQIERIHFSIREPADGQSMAIELSSVDLLLKRRIVLSAPRQVYKMSGWE